jgi:hypothetical protein
LYRPCRLLRSMAMIRQFAAQTKTAAFALGTEGTPIR